MIAPVTSSAVSQQIALVRNDEYHVYKATILSSGTATAVYTAGAASLRQIHLVQSIVICNVSGGAVNITIVLHRAADATDYTFYPQTSLADKARLIFPADGDAELQMPLEPSDEFRVTGASGIHVLVTAHIVQGNVK